MSAEIIDRDDSVVARSGIDYTSEHGAAVIKRAIERYWAERGCTVMVVLHNAGFTAATRAARHDVRSDMLNGWPVKRQEIAR